MRATAVEFRLRMLINAAIIVLGFWAPWIDAWGMGSRISLMEWLALEMHHAGMTSFALATGVVIMAAACIAGLAAVLRIWGSAHLGPGTVIHPQMRAGAVVADGPYRFVRNPLYLGLWCMVAAMAFLMPPGGALVAIILVTIFLLRLILAEESFLLNRIGEPYQAYLREVPRLVPRLPAAPQAAGVKPHWARAILSELTAIGVFVALGFLSWTYDQGLMIRTILISFGISLLVRALMMERAPVGQPE